MARIGLAKASLDSRRIVSDTKQMLAEIVWSRMVLGVALGVGQWRQAKKWATTQSAPGQVGPLMKSRSHTLAVAFTPLDTGTM